MSECRENWNPNTCGPECDWCGECDWCLRGCLHVFEFRPESDTAACLDCGIETSYDEAALWTPPTTEPTTRREVAASTKESTT